MSIILLLIFREMIGKCYAFATVAQKNRRCVKMGKKKPDVIHPVEIGVNRHSEMNDGNK